MAKNSHGCWRVTPVETYLLNWLNRSFQNSVSVVSALQPLFMRVALTDTRRAAEAESVERPANLRLHQVKQRERWQCGEPFRRFSFPSCLPVCSVSQAFHLANELCHLFDVTHSNTAAELPDRPESAAWHAWALCFSYGKRKVFVMQRPGVFS